MSEQGVSASESGAASDRARLEAAVAACEVELADISRESAPREWAMVQLRLGEALRELVDPYQNDWPRNSALLTQARQSFEAGLEVAVQLPPHDRAMLQMRLGQLLSGTVTNRSRSILLCSEAT